MRETRQSVIRTMSCLLARLPFVELGDNTQQGIASVEALPWLTNRSNIREQTQVWRKSPTCTGD